MESIAGRVAFVTGASRGIGAAIARALHAEGAHVGVASRSGADLGLERGMGIECDVRNAGSVRTAVAAVVERFGGLDIVVINAGVGAYGPFLELPDEHLDEMIEVNVRGAINTARATLPHLLASDAADLVTIASEAGRRGLPLEAVYCASKFAQVGLTAALDHELREHGVRCTSICPGGVATDFAMGRGRTPEMPQLATLMHPEDVAESVLSVVTRPRTHRVVEVAFRPMSEPSWG
jgi:3-oxoacyl-[acyl-carrier protein] reductase